MTNTAETEEFADSLRWAHDVGKPGVERLRKRFAVSIIPSEVFRSLLIMFTKGMGSYLRPSAANPA